MEITQKILKFDVLNLNGRIYTKESISKAIKDVRNKTKEMGVFYGCLGYPEDDKFRFALNVSHSIEKIYIRNNILFAKISILNTESSKILKDNIDSYVFRPRMIGNVDENNICQVDDIISIDAILKDTDSYKGII